MVGPVLNWLWSSGAAPDRRPAAAARDDAAGANPCPPIYRDPTARATLHLYALLESVHNAGIPVIDFPDLMRSVAAGGAGPDRVVMHPRLIGGGSGSVAEMAVLAAIAAAKRPRRVLEFGTYDGCSTWHLLANAPPDARVVTLDLPPLRKVAGSTDDCLQGVTRREFLPADGRVTLVETDSRDWQPDPGEGPYDLCFIDAGHSYECVRNDTEKALTLMRPDGVVVWHDASWTDNGYGVNKYLRGLVRAGRPVRLVRASPYDYCAIAVLLLGEAAAPG